METMHYCNEKGGGRTFLWEYELHFNFCNFVLRRARLQNLLMLLVLLQWRQDSQWDRVFRKYMLAIGLYRLNLLLYTSLFSFQVPGGNVWKWKKYLSSVWASVYCNINRVSWWQYVTLHFVIEERENSKSDDCGSGRLSPYLFVATGW